MTTSGSSTNLASALAPSGTKDFRSEIYVLCSGIDGTGETANTTVTVAAPANP